MAERETDSMHPNNPFNYKKPPMPGRSPLMTQMEKVFRLPWAKPLSSGSKGKSNTRIARTTGIKFGHARKKKNS